MWIWGTVLTVLVTTILLSFVIAAFHVEADGKWNGGTFLRGLYAVIRNNQTILAALVATLGVAWSWFFQVSYKDPSATEKK